MIASVIHMIKLRQAEIAQSLMLGNAFNWESYQRMVGEGQGLQFVLDSIDKLLDEEKNQE
jgi:hypothetical protein